MVWTSGCCLTRWATQRLICACGGSCIRVGDKILTQLLRMPPGSSQLSQVHYSDAAGAAPAELAHLQVLSSCLRGSLGSIYMHMILT